MAITQVLRSRGDDPSRSQRRSKDFTERLSERMDILLKGLQVAETVHGFVVDDEKDTLNKLRQAQIKQLERQERGITTAPERAAMQAKGFDIKEVERPAGPQPAEGRMDPGFIKATIAPGSTLLEGVRGQQFEAKFIGPPGKTPRVGTKLLKDVIDPKTGKRSVMIVEDKPGVFQAADELEKPEDERQKNKDINAETRALRKDYQGSSSTSPTRLTERAVQEFGRLEKLINSPDAKGGAKDIAIIKIFEKTLDPTSAIRESEFAIQRAAGSWDEQVKAWIGSVISGQKLDENMRQRILQTARLDLMSRLEGQSIRDKQWRTIIEANPLDVDADLVINPLFQHSMTVIGRDIEKSREKLKQMPGATPGAGGTPYQQKRNQRKQDLLKGLQEKTLPQSTWDRLKKIFE